MSDTPRTDALTFDVITIRGDAHLGRENYNDGWGEFVESKFARTLEREINASNDRINQLETENDAMRADLLLWHEQEVKP